MHGRGQNQETVVGSRYLEERVRRLLAPADVCLGGRRPWDLRVRNHGFYARVLGHGSLGLGETYMDGWWDTDALDVLLCRMLEAGLDRRVRTLDDGWTALRALLLNLPQRRPFEIGQHHYDLGNDLYQAMLGRRLVYSCGYWRTANDLDTAQEHKLDLVCRKLLLRPGLSVLDIGCGWGEALRFAAERHGVSGTGVTVSAAQADYASELCRGLPVEIHLQDYRDLTGRFDRIFSVGMFEHVGVRNYRRHLALVREHLADDGLFLLHTIGGNESVRAGDPWVERYIFPNSMLPSAAQITRALEGLFVIEDWHNFGCDYDRTLQAWRDNVEQAWPALGPRYDERFRRMWRYYLSASMALFRSRRSQLWQIVLSPRGIPGGYVAPR